MNNQNISKHDKNIITQFSKQAIPFTQLPGHFDSIQMLIEMSKVSDTDNVLDIACGPGIVACEFAKIASHVTGIDITEKMISQAKSQQAKLNLSNMSWDIGSASPLPYVSDSFSKVITRYSFHHFLKPEIILKEMIRVCKPGGIILVADADLPNDKVNNYNKLEKLRDPSHTKALSHKEWKELFIKSELQNLQQSSYKVPMELENQLKASFPNKGDEDKIRKMFIKDLSTNSLGMDTHKKGNEIHFSYPISIFIGYK